MNTRMRGPARNRKRITVDEADYNQLRYELARLRAQLDKQPKLLEDCDSDLPPLPAADKHGRYPAVETARIIIARQIIRGRKAAGWTQAQLAEQAGVRQETVSRIETGKHSPGLNTMAKIDRALKKAGV